MRTKSQQGLSGTTLAAWAKKKGVTLAAASKMAKRNGIVRQKNGLWNVAELEEAWLMGKARDKASKSRAARDAEPNSLTRAKLDAQVRKLEIEISILEAERDRTLDKLLDVDAATAAVARLHSEVATRINTWRESEGAKHPQHAESIDDLSNALHQMLAEPVDW